MIDREHKLSVVRQTMLLGFSRGSVYYSPRPVSDGDLALMRRRTNAAHSLGDR
jgi:putative transposase